MIPRTDERPSWEWGLTLIGHGRAGRERTADNAVLKPNRSRIEYD